MRVWKTQVVMENAGMENVGMENAGIVMENAGSHGKRGYKRVSFNEHNFLT